MSAFRSGESAVWPGAGSARICRAGTGLHHIRRPGLPSGRAFSNRTVLSAAPAWTAVGKMLSDHITAVDVLSSPPQVNSHRIGVIGHSLGGYNGWFLAGMDKRIKAVVSSRGFTMFRGDPEPNRWGGGSGFPISLP